MAIHLIGIGGTGHRVLNAILNIAAAGLFDSTKINMLTIDSDGGNGDFNNLKDTLKFYTDYQKTMQTANSPVGVSQIMIPGEGGVNWSPLSGDIVLRDYINKTRLSKDLQDVLDFLYTENEQDRVLKEGFYGHPSIGSYIIQKELEKSEKWESFTEEIKENDCVFIIGSVYGGTGASGIPVITKMLNDLHERPKIVTLLSMPYFTPIETKADKNRDDNPDTLMPDRAYFIPKTKGALYYYHQQKYSENVDALYIIGEKTENFSQEKFSAGGTNQTHKPHITELFAATSLLNFIEVVKQKQEFSVYIGQREKSTENGQTTMPYTWEMINAAGFHLEKKLKLFTMMSIIYTKIFYHELTTGKSTAKKILNSRIDRAEAVSLYNCMLKYCEWLKEMHTQNVLSNGVFEKIPYPLVKLFDFTGRENLCNGRYPQQGVILDGFKNLICGLKIADSDKIYGDIIKKLPDGCDISVFVKCLYDTCDTYLKGGK